MRAAVLLAIAGCTHPPAPAPNVRQSASLVALSAGECRQLLHDDGTAASLEQAAARSADYARGLPPDRVLTVAGSTAAAAAMATMDDAVAHAAHASADLPQALCDRFRIYRVPGPALATGYYEPELPASRQRTERFRYPIYRTPDDIVDVDLGRFCAACAGRITQARVHDRQLTPYYSRAEIDAGALAGRGYEVAWLDDPVEAYFMHVQGSAALDFQDGTHMQVSYASSNGRPYTSIGRALVDAGKLAPQEISLAALKGYLRAHPDERARWFGENERYIFFRTVAAGPVGRAGVPLTAGRSVAADPAVYPAGTLLFMRIQPRPGAATTASITRLGFVQDSGVALVGAGRIDIFWGNGPTAEAIAGDLQNPAELYVILPQ